MNQFSISTSTKDPVTCSAQRLLQVHKCDMLAIPSASNKVKKIYGVCGERFLFRERRPLRRGMKIGRR